MKCHVSRMLLFLLFVVTPLAAQSHYTGADWNRWPKDKKLTYVAGWVDGTQHGLYEALSAYRPDLLKQWFDPNSSVIKRFSSNITVGQLVAGVDKLYDDYKNLNIEVRSAVPVIDEDVTGKKPLTDEFLIQLRRASATEKRE